MQHKISFIFLLLLPFFSLAQQPTIPIQLSLFNEATAIPFTRFFTVPIHPGIQIGTSFNYKQKQAARFFQTANVFYFYHKHLNQAIGLNTEVGYEHQLSSGFAFAGLLGIGYLHSLGTAKEFVFANGHYQEKTDKGNARLSPSFALDLGYYWKKSERNSPKIFIRYQAWAEYPYSPGFIPVMTHTSLHIGTTFFLSSNKTKND